MDMSDILSASAFHSLLACEVEQRSSGNYSNHWRDSQRRCLEARYRSQTENRNETLPGTRTQRTGSERFSKIYNECLFESFCIQYFSCWHKRQYLMGLQKHFFWVLKENSEITCPSREFEPPDVLNIFLRRGFKDSLRKNTPKENWPREIFSRGFLSHLARQTKWKRDYS